MHNYEADAAWMEAALRGAESQDELFAIHINKAVKLLCACMQAARPELAKRLGHVTGEVMAALIPCAASDTEGEEDAA